MFSSKNIQLNIGEWNQTTSVEIINNYLSSLDLNITTIDGNTINLTDYIKSVVVVNNEINPLFKNYNYGEIKNLIQTIINDSKSFLSSSNNQLSLSSSTISYKDIELTKKFLPGDYYVYYDYLLTANLAEFSYYSPLTLSYALEFPTDYDLSDFAIELLFDQNAFASSKPFSYDYLLYDDNAWTKQVVNDEVNESRNKLVTLSSDVSYVTKAYVQQNNSYVLSNYKQITVKPTLSGYWARFPVGPNYYLDKPTDSPLGNQQLFTIMSPKTRTGMILSGKANGKIIELKVDIPFKNPSNGENLPIIPFALVISRGVSVNDNNIPLTKQRTDAITPVVKFKYYQGQVWN
jgi:hypothetical protein